MSIPSGARVDPIKTNEETERTKNKLTTYLMEAMSCFCWDVNNKKNNIRDNSNINDNGDNNIHNDNNNSSSSNNHSYKNINNDKGNRRKNDNNCNNIKNTSTDLENIIDYTNNDSYDNKSNNNNDENIGWLSTEGAKNESLLCGGGHLALVFIDSFIRMKFCFYDIWV